MKDRCRKMIGIWLCVVGWTGFSAEGKAQEVITAAEDTIRIPANVAIKPWIGTDTVSMSHTPASFKPNPKKVTAEDETIKKEYKIILKPAENRSESRGKMG